MRTASGRKTSFAFSISWSWIAGHRSVNSESEIVQIHSNWARSRRSSRCSVGAAPGVDESLGATLFDHVRTACILAGAAIGLLTALGTFFYGGASRIKVLAIGHGRREHACGGGMTRGSCLIPGSESQ